MSVNIRITKLMFGAPGNRACHVCVDMQRLFAEPGEWFTPGLMEIVPVICRLAEPHAARTVFTRFVTPTSPEAASGRWRAYYERWRAYTTDVMGEEMLDLVEPLRRFCPPAAVIDKTAHSAFESADFVRFLKERDCDTVILTGVETDVCVLATALGAVDRGLRVIVIADAVTSSSPEGHRDSINSVMSRFDMQIETAQADEVIAAWR